jgi:mRNA interferase RelE/StbE
MIISENMELIVKGTFYRDISAYTNRHLLKEVYDVMQNISNADSIFNINDLKKLKKYKNQYRIKILKSYRIGIVVQKNKVWFVRFGHRNSFYKGFP